jgi:hypothetical protein
MQLSLEQFPESLRPLLKAFDIDFAPQRSPSLPQVGVATLVAIVLSLVADWALAKLGIALYPDQRNYQHFQFAEYAKLTIIGILGAGVAWPIVTRISSKAKRLYFKLEIIVVLVTFLPDVAIWWLGQPATAVFVLVWMHLAIAVITYPTMVLLAPVRSLRRG